MAATAANAKKVYAKASAAAPSSGDEILGVLDVKVSRSRAAADITAYSDGIYHVRLPTLIDVSISMSGVENYSDTPQGLIRSYFLSGATLYITVLDDGTNGYTYPTLVTAYEPSGAVGDAAQFSATFELNGTPVAVP